MPIGDSEDKVETVVSVAGGTAPEVVVADPDVIID